MSMTKFFSWFVKHKSIVILCAILFLAALLRLYKIGDYMTFLGDEGRDLLEVLKILSGHLVFLGPRSSAADFYYGPIYFYFITPFLWLFNYDPVGPAVFIALVGIITVYFVYFVGKKLFNETAGLFAAALYTVSPIVIAYSRSSWNPNPLPFISLLSFYIVYNGVKKYSWKYFLFLGFLLGIAIQLQYLALFLGFIIFLFIILGSLLEKQTRQFSLLLKEFSLILAGYLMGWSPFLVFELKHGFPNLRTIVQFILFGNPTKAVAVKSDFITNIWTVFFNLFGRLVTRFPPPEQVNINENLNLSIWQFGTVVLGILAILSLYFVKNKLVKLLFGLWFFVGIFLFGFYKGQIYDYYLGFMFPLPFLLIGNFLSLSFTGKLKNKRISLLIKLLSLILLLALFFFNLDGNPFKNTPNRQKDQVKLIAEFVLSKTGGKPYNFALLTKGNSDHAYRYFFEREGKPPVAIEYEAKDPERKTVTDQLLIVCEDPDCQPVGNGLWEVAGFGRAEIENEWPVSVVKVYKLVHFVEK